jgi:dynein heavy chain
MLEDLNNILNSADVPNIYKMEDKEEINDVGRMECGRRNMPPTEMNMMNMYLLRVKQNIHIMLAMSPLGELFRSRLRMFPSLINCCTIDWFSEWPEEALLSVAKGAVDQETMKLEN